MPVFNMYGGGLGLNINVVSYESSFPSSANDNTIGIISTTPVSEFVVSSTEPTNPSGGMAWVKSGAVSSVPIQISDNVTIYPVFVKQYISGSWQIKISKVYKTSEGVSGWNDIWCYIYADGTQYIPLVRSSSYITFAVGCIDVNIPNTKRGSFCTTEAINNTGYTKICVERERVTSQTNGRSYIGFNSTSSTTTGAADVFYEEVDRTTQSKSVKYIDITGATVGTYYVKWSGYAGGNDDALDNKIYKIWLE